MTAKSATTVQQATGPEPYEITFTVTRSGVLAIPPGPEIPHGKNVVFVNDTPGRVKIFMAADGVLKGQKELVPIHVSGNHGRSKRLEVENNPGEHEYAVHFKFKDPETNKWRTGFAKGASSPRIVIVDP